MRGCLPIILAGRISSHYMWTTPDVLWLFCETWVTSAWSSCQYFSNLLYKKLPNLYNSSMKIELTSVSLIRMELLSSSSDFINIYITFHQAAPQGCPAGIITYVIKLSLWIWKSFSMFWITFLFWDYVHPIRSSSEGRQHTSDGPWAVAIGKSCFIRYPMGITHHLKQVC